MKTLNNIKKENFELKEVEINIIDELKKLIGKKFKAKITEVICEGKIQVEDNILYLCQNERSGAHCSNKLGYNHSWQVQFAEGKNFEESLKIWDVIEFTLLDSELPVFETKPFLISTKFAYNFYISEDGIKAGCQKLSEADVKFVLDSIRKLKKKNK